VAPRVTFGGDARLTRESRFVSLNFDERPAPAGMGMLQ
jgi:hypothetical protein